MNQHEETYLCTPDIVMTSAWFRNDFIEPLESYHRCIFNGKTESMPGKGDNRAFKAPNTFTRDVFVSTLQILQRHPKFQAQHLFVHKRKR